MAQKLAAGNWKMNGTEASLAEIDKMLAAYPEPGCKVLICPPATLLDRLSTRIGDGPIATGAQDCHMKASGAHTGDISADMIKDAGGTYAILGHSERRTDHGESDEVVKAKSAAAVGAGLIAVVCVGETEAQRDAGQTLDVVGTQLAGSVPDDVTGETLVVAYEPVWAIGTGRVPTIEQIAEVHDFIREKLVDRFGAETGNAVSLLYGGSVKPSNAAEIFAVANVDGALVGGASLKADDFGAIIDALQSA
ncbi:triose-phosphate isomerase [Tropicimonas isoalkanivorans]|uniref:Triosephosphate isomerase n=1 Tax=Tropicimonas isoalkanivorans TaxID=441112 RepID=A0A1I1FXX2_9RHOB|nr:triose-phosphate isomerase [Tropicimonas isoalkanivorans]SFC04317.1 triosephosphate isomerase [Tropicimonas isoalkanivorans]